MRYEEWFITDVETDVDGLGDLIGEYENIATLNELADKLGRLSEWEVKKVQAILEAECLSLEALNRLLDDDCSGYELLSGVDDEEDLGHYCIDQCCALEIPGNIQPYFDFRAYGRDVSLDESGTFTAWGYLLSMA